MSPPERPAVRAPAGALEVALAAEEAHLLQCVHCGFCLPSCPTYVRLGDEADSPRGRLHLMRAVVEGRLAPDAPAFATHLDRCLGCRACEPVCPSGVPYGHLLERARAVVRERHGSPGVVRGLLAVFARPGLTRWSMATARALRWTGLPAGLTRLLPGSLRLPAAMLAASAPVRLHCLGRGAGPSGGAGGASARASAAPVDPRAGPVERAAAASSPAVPRATRTGRGVAPGAATAGTGELRGPARTTVGLLTGCVQQGLFGRVNAATARTLVANGYEVVPMRGQGCCGALHAHAGDLDGARRLARRNVAAFRAAGADRICANAAGCGALLREYGELLADDPAGASDAADVAARVADVSELLADRGPRRGAPIACAVAYDPPCHLVHAQGVAEPPIRVLDAVPGLDRRPVERATECCGGAGLYGMTHPELGSKIGQDKAEALLASGAEVVATGNPGCAMQIGATLRLAGRRLPVVHPVELLDESYRRAGLYESADGEAGV